MESRHSTIGMRSNPHLGRLAIVMAVCTLYYYLDVIAGSVGWTSVENALGKLHDFHGLVFFAPVVYAAYVSGMWGALLAALAAAAVLYPYAAYVSPYSDALYRPAVLGTVLATVGASIAMLQRSDEQQRRSMNELKCLYDIGKAAEESGSMDEFLSSSVEIIPNAVHCHDRVRVRITARGKSFLSRNFGECPGTIRETLMSGDDPLGSIEVFCPSERRPLLKDYQTLLKTIADRISGALRRMELEQSLKVYSEQLEEMVEMRTTDLNQAHQQLCLLSDTVKSSLDGITLVDMEGNLTFANEAAEKMWGYNYNELTHMKLSQLYSPNEFDLVENEIIPNSRTDVWSGELTALAKDREQFAVMVTTSPVHDESGQTVAMVGVHRDISETKEMRDKLIRSERLAAVGELASGVGHELRNPLNVIRNCVYLLNMTLADQANEEISNTLRLLDQQVDISNKIVTDLLNFTRARPPSLARVDLNSLVKESLSWVQIPEDIAVIVDYDGNYPAILADAEQVGRAFANIVSNAVQSMNGSGKLTVGTKTDEGYARITFEDTGCGIPEENLEKIFQPLFTTKARGIGLGLAITKGLIEQNGGAIKVASQVEKGTAFTVTLPVFQPGEKQQ